MKFESHLLDVLRTESGRVVLAYILREASPVSSDVNEVFHLSKLRRKIEAEIQQADFDLYLKMLKEEHDRE